MGTEAKLLTNVISISSDVIGFAVSPAEMNKIVRVSYKEISSLPPSQIKHSPFN